MIIIITLILTSIMIGVITPMFTTPIVITTLMVSLSYMVILKILTITIIITTNKNNCLNKMSNCNSTLYINNTNSTLLIMVIYLFN